MLQFTALTIILANIVLGVFGHPVREAIEGNTTEAHEQTPFGNGIDKKTKCQSYFHVYIKLESCMNHAQLPAEMNTNYVLGAIEHTCSNNVQIKECMKTEFLDCENWSVIEKIVDMSVGLCNTFMLDDIKQFLRDNTNVTLPRGCLLKIWKETKDHCDTEERPRIDVGNDNGFLGVDKALDFTQRLFEFIVKCVSTNPYLDIEVQECSGLTRRKVYGILASLVAAANPGVNFNPVYPTILAFIKEPAAMMQQAIYQFA